MQGRTLPDGNLCLAITSLTVKFGLRSRRIVIASELASRPCLLDHVTRHERKLAAIDDKLVAEFIPLMRDQLEQSWKDGLGVDVRDEPDGHAALKTLIDARLVELRSRFTSARDKAQDALDAEDFAPDALAPACREEQRQLLGTGP